MNSENRSFRKRCGVNARNIAGTTQILSPAQRSISAYSGFGVDREERCENYSVNAQVGKANTERFENALV